MSEAAYNKCKNTAKCTNGKTFSDEFKLISSECLTATQIKMANNYKITNNLLSKV